MLGAWTIRRGFKHRKAKDKTYELMINICASRDPAVVDRGDEDMCRDNISFTAGPYGALQIFNGGHLFGGFKDFDNRSRHRVRRSGILIR